MKCQFSNRPLTLLLEEWPSGLMNPTGTIESARRETNSKSKKPMKKLHGIIALIAVAGMTALFTGCGGGGDNGGGGQNATGTETGTRVNAPATLAGQTYSYRSNTGESGTITFFDNRSFEVRKADGTVTTSGTYVASRDNDIYTTRVTTTGGGTGTLQLNFNAASGGFFTLSIPGQEPVSGSFSAPSAAGSTGGNTGGTNGNTNGNNNGGTTGTAPTVTVSSQPAAANNTITVTNGQTVRFTATATGNPAPTYQWKKDGAAIAGATAATLTLSNVTTNNNGAYTVTVTNSKGTATSSPALAVNVTTGGDGGGGNNGGGGGFAPASLNGKVYHFNVTAGPFANSQYDVTFTGGTFSVSNGSEGSGNYTYTPNGNNAHLRMNYTAPPAANGDFDDLNLTYGSATTASFTGNSNTGQQDHTDAAGTITDITP